MEPDKAERIADRILGREIAREIKESQKLLGRDQCNRVFDFFGVTTPVRVASCEVASQKVASRARWRKRAEAAKGLQCGRAAPT